MPAPKGPTLVTIPPELCRYVLESLSSRDVIALRLVSRAFHNYFTSDEVCHYAHKLYFPLSSECNKKHRTRRDFDAAYFRSMNWKQGNPSHVEVIEKVARASTSLTNGFLVDSNQNLLIYQRYNLPFCVCLLVLFFLSFFLSLVFLRLRLCKSGSDVRLCPKAPVVLLCSRI